MRLNDLMELAFEAHSGQEDKAKKPYILHPWRVSLNVFSKVAKLRVFRGVSEDVLHKAVMVCVGHDLVEDTWVTLDILRERGLAEDIVQGIANLTKQGDDEDYFVFCKRCMDLLISWIAKIADIVDNSDVDRIPVEKRTAYDASRTAKYSAALSLMGVEPDEMGMLLTYI